MTEPVPAALRARITAVALTYACPVCNVAVDSLVEAAPDGGCALAVELADRFDLCSHCGQLLDFGAVLTQEAA